MGNHASCRICDALEQVNSAMAKCRLCRTGIPAIEASGEREFIFDWLPFHWPNSECVRLIALTMEPAKPGTAPVPGQDMGAFRPLIVRPTAAPGSAWGRVHDHPHRQMLDKGFNGYEDPQ